MKEQIRNHMYNQGLKPKNLRQLYITISNLTIISSEFEPNLCDDKDQDTTNSHNTTRIKGWFKPQKSNSRTSEMSNYRQT